MEIVLVEVQSSAPESLKPHVAAPVKLFQRLHKYGEIMSHSAVFGEPEDVQLYVRALDYLRNLRKRGNPS